MVPISRSCSNSNPRHAFTLVELLVVISIIALLVGLLLPALSAAKYRARKVTSLNNMHQTSIAIFVYAEDFQTQVPSTVRQDQGCNFWGNFYIYVYPTHLLYGIGYTIKPYVASSDIFMAPNYWDHLTSSVDEGNVGGGFGWWYGWYQNPGWLQQYAYNITSYDYLPWLGFEPAPPPDSFGNGPGPTMRLDQSMVGTYIGGPPVPFNRITLLEEALTVSTRDADPTDPFKSTNFVNGQPDGGNLVFGDGSGIYVPTAAYYGAMSNAYVSGGYNYTNYDVLYKK